MTSTSGAAQRPDINEMRVIHRVFRREFAQLPALIRGVRDGDTERAAVVADHATRVLTFLGIHHQGEDELLWPLIEARATLRADLVRRMEAQHQVVAELIERAGKQLPAWAGAPTSAKGGELAAIIEDLRRGLLEHLDEEEREILPLVEEHLSVDEWAKLAEHGRSHAGAPPQMMLILAMILEEATPDERAHMLSPMPPPAREAFAAQGEPAYAAYVARVRQTA